MNKLLWIVLLSVSLFAKYDNCSFKNKDYEDICQKVVKKGVSYRYANEFLLSYFKTKKFDEISWKYIQPSKIKYHRKREKQANNTLVSYVPKMVQNLQKYKKVYDMAEERYGVNREIISAILLKETKLGLIKPTHDAFVVFNTFLIRVDGDSSRERWLKRMSKTNMVSIIDYCYKKDVKPEECNLPSSYAGAVGIPQFMPNSFIYADSYSGGVAELTKMEDAIMSAAKFLNKKANFDTLIVWDKMPDIAKIEREWYEYDFTHKDASFVYEKSKSGKVYNCFTKNKPELEYLKGYVKKIMRYNNSSNYAIGVIRLAWEAHYSK